MKLKLLLVCLLLFVLSQGSLFSITPDQEAEKQSLYEEQKILVDSLTALWLDQEKQLKNSKESLNERKADLNEREELRKKKNALIVEREQELRKTGIALAIEKSRYATLEKLYEDSQKQLKDTEKLTERSWPGIIDFLIWIGIAALFGYGGYRIGGIEW